MSLIIQTYADDEELTAAVLNRPITQLRDAIDAANASLATITSHQTVLRKGVVCNPPVPAGTVVYMDSYGVAKPALAQWSAANGDQGEALPAESAYPLGVLVDVEEGLVVTGGVLDADYVGDLFGGDATPEPGVCYLSDTVAGAVTLTRTAMGVRVAVVDSTNTITLVNFNAPAGYHVHKKFEVATDTGWTQDTDEGIWTYTGDAIDDLIAFGVTDATILQVEGQLLTLSDKFSLVRATDGSVSLTANADPSSTDAVYIYTTLPFTPEQPVVRAISSGSPRLRATAMNGVVKLSLDPDAEPPVEAASAKAVSTLLPNGGYGITPVVSSISIDGSGSVVPNPTTGAYAISVGYAENHILSPDIVSLDGVTVTYLNDQLIYVFPVGRTSKVVGSFSVKAPPAGKQWGLYPYVEVAGVTGSSSEFTITPLFSGAPAFDTETAMAAAAAPLTETLTVSAATDKRKGSHTATGIPALTAGTLSLSVQTTAAPVGTAWKILRIGAVVKMETPT